jgi:hypothetical protein
VDEHLKELMQELGQAINESLSESDRIAAALGEIRRSGYDVFLVLEATIGFNKRDDELADLVENADERDVARSSATASLKWTNQDARFLKSLKISTDENPADVRHS